MRILISGLLSAALFLLTSSPAQIKKQEVHAASVKVTTAVDKPSAPQQSAPSQPEVVAPQEPVKAPEPAPQVVETPQPLTDHEQLMQAAGIEQSDWPAVEFIIMHESSWQPTALNSEGCVGLGQRCPASTLYAACPDLDPVCQLRHFTNYAVSRYGGWQSAYNAWTNKNWW